MRLAWLGLATLAALSACAPYPYPYGYDSSYWYGSPAVAGYDYYGGYAAPYYAPVPPLGPPGIVLGGERPWHGDRWREGWHGGRPGGGPFGGEPFGGGRFGDHGRPGLPPR